MWPFSKGHRGKKGSRERREERLACELLSTQYGRVIDLSAGGMRVHGRGKCELTKGKLVPVKLKCAHGALSLMGQVAWTRKSLLGGYEAGIQLQGVKAQTAALLRQLAQFGFLPQGETTATESSGGRKSPAEAAFEDPYAVLGIDASTSDSQVQATYRRLALACHPDHDRSPNAAARFERLTRAYQAIRKRRCGFNSTTARAA